MTSTPPKPTEFGIKLTDVRVIGFKTLVDVEVPISDRVTVLVGENNSGKTSFLEALQVGFGTRRAANEDLHVNGASVRATAAFVVMRFAPNGEGRDEFAETVVNEFTSAVQFDKAGDQNIIVRTKIAFAGSDKEPQVTREFLKAWPTQPAKVADAEAVDNAPLFGRELRKRFYFDYLDARRDIIEEIRNKKSYWGRILSETSIPPDQKATLEAGLKALGDSLKAGSPVLMRLTQDLASMPDALGAKGTTFELDPLPRRVDDLVKSIDVVVSSPGASTFHVGEQGMGTRSLAAIFAFKGYVNNKRVDAEADSALSVASFEEPESHLHPHAQRQVFRVLSEITGQCIISTHSVHVASVADIADFRVFRREGAASTAKWMPRSDVEKLPNLPLVRRLLLGDNPDSLFARAVGIVEGQTESEALPIFGRNRWKPHGPDTVGISIALLGGAKSADSVATVLDRLGVPWLCLLDRDPAGEEALVRLTGAIGREFTFESKQIATYARGRWEEHVLDTVDAGTLREVIEVWLATYGENDAATEGVVTSRFEDRKHSLQGQKRKGGGTRDYTGPDGDALLTRDLIELGKAKVGVVLAERLCRNGEARCGLSGVDDFFDRLETLAREGMA